MTFKDLVIASLAKADEEPGEEIFEDAVSKGINQAYMMIATSLEPHLDTKTLTMSNDMTLPDDFVQVAELYAGEQKLSSNDFKLLGRTIRITNRDYMATGTEYTLDYICFPPVLVEDTDIPMLSEARQLLLIDYGAYECLLLKRKYESATARLQSFLSAVQGGGE